MCKCAGVDKENSMANRAGHARSPCGILINSEAEDFDAQSNDLTAAASALHSGNDLERR